MSDPTLTHKLAREADFEVLSDGRVLSLAQDEDITRRLARFAALVAEECAKVVDDLLREHQVSADPCHYEDCDFAAAWTDAAQAIRERFKP